MNISTNSTGVLTPYIFLALALIVTALVYWPGLNGPFLLDDKPNLAPLKTLSVPLTVDKISRYVIEESGHPGRVLARLSFVPHYANWPENPYNFKRVNILIHLVNGLLLVWLFTLIDRLRNYSLDRALSWTAVIVATIWLLHPFVTSTVLYVIQRMTLLATSFMLLGLIAYMHGRRLAGRRLIPAYLIMTGGITLGTVLGTLCKENAILLSSLVIVIEVTLFANVRRPMHWWIWAVIVLLPPIIFVVGWHVWKWPELMAGYTSRSFDLGERLLTEGRILWDYLYHILVPVRWGTGLFHDDFLISRGLFEPLTTFMAVAGVFLALALGILWRSRFSVIAFSVLWLLGGLVLESTVLPLEPYFEHRNYLPMIGPLYALVHYALAIRGRLYIAIRCTLAIYIFAAAINTHYNVLAWSDQLLLSLTWEDEHPESSRALQFAANTWLVAGKYDEVQQRLDKVLRLNPNATAPTLQQLMVRCLEGSSVQAPHLNHAKVKLAGRRLDNATLPTLDQIVELVSNKRCNDFSEDQLSELIKFLISETEQHGNTTDTSHLWVLWAKLYNLQNQKKEAALALAEAYRYRPSVRVAMYESVSWAHAGDIDRALAAVAKAKAAAKLRSPWIEWVPKDIVDWETYLKGKKEHE